MAIWRVAAVLFLIAGLLETAFAMFSCMGMGMGGVMSVVPTPNPEDRVLGVLVLFVYGFLLLVTIISGPLHAAAGFSMLGSQGRRPLVWIAIAVSVLPVVTVYCAPLSLAAGILGLVALLQSPDGGGASGLQPK